MLNTLTNVRNRKWTDEEFLARRPAVLAQWPTGAEVDLDEAIEYHKTLPDSKVYAKKLAKFRQAATPMFEAEMGHALFDQTLEHLVDLVNGGWDATQVIFDTYTRRSLYHEAKKGVELSQKAGKSTLNGFPIVYYGPKKARDISRLVDMPMRCSNCQGDEPMLNAEVALASGFTGLLDSSILDLVLHSKNYPLAKKLENTQYDMRLAAYFTERGAPIQIIDTTVCSVLAPPSVLTTLMILAVLMAAEQGVKHVVAGTNSYAHLLQDVASAQVEKKLLREYLDRAGHSDIDPASIRWPWMSDWPRTVSQATALLTWCAISNSFAGIDVSIIKSVAEGVSIPSKEDHELSLRAAKQAFLMTKGQSLPESKELGLEREMIEKEVRAMIDRIYEVGDGDICVGLLRACESGEFDFPFCGWNGVRGNVMPVRDVTGAVRWLKQGDLPFPKEVIEYNDEKVRERTRRENRDPMDFILDDIMMMSRDVIAEGLW